MKYQFMPMFWGDFFANTLHLTAQEVGAYVLLIAHAWENGGRVPYSRLQRIARVNPYHWEKVWKQLEPFFVLEPTTVGTPLWVTHTRVLNELTKAGEISNKRKGAALQMHSKSRANGHANGHHTTTTLPIENLTDGKGRETAPMPQDKGDDYRSPPATKSDHVLTPLPDKPPRPPLQKPVAEKKPDEASRQELDAIYAARESTGIRRP